MTYHSEVRPVRKQGTRVRVFQPTLAEQRLMGMNALDDARCPDVVRAAYNATVARSDELELAA